MMVGLQFDVPVSHAPEPAAFYRALPLMQLNGMQPLRKLISTPVFGKGTLYVLLTLRLMVTTFTWQTLLKDV